MYSVQRIAQQLSVEALLAAGGLSLFVGIFLLGNPVAPWMPTVAPTDPFLRGEYYFNHDADAKGPYDLEKAREAYMEALEMDPKGNARTWYQLGRIDFIEGKFISALYKFEKQIEYFNDQIPNVYYMIGLTYGFKAGVTGSEEDWEAAAEGFKTYLTYEPESPWARTDLSWVYFSQGDYARMLPVLEDGLVMYPDHPWLLNMYGLALFNTGERARAHEIFVHAAQEAEKLTTSDWGRAYPGNNPNEWEAGLRSFEEAIQKNSALTAPE